MDLFLKGKTAVVTGSSKGVGAGICKVLASEGCNIVVNYHANAELAESFAQELEKTYGVKAAAIQGDVSLPETAEDILKQTLEIFGDVHILVNNAAGGCKSAPMDTLDPADWHRGFASTLDSVFLMCRAFCGYWKNNQKKGHIVNISSKSAILSTSVGNETYVTSKAGVAALTRAMAKEFAPLGIYINCIFPGYVYNWKSISREHSAGTERFEKTIKLIPSGDYAQPTDIGNIVAFLCSPVSNQICGSLIDTTGGTLL